MKKEFDRFNDEPLKNVKLPIHRILGFGNNLVQGMILLYENQNKKADMMTISKGDTALMQLIEFGTGDSYLYYEENFEHRTPNKAGDIELKKIHISIDK